MCVHISQSLSITRVLEPHPQVVTLFGLHSRDSECCKERRRLKELRILELGPQPSLLTRNTHHHLHYDIFCMSAFSLMMGIHYSGF